MTHSQYTLGGENPGKIDTILLHPFVTPLSVVSFFTGVMAILSAIFDFSISRALNESHPMIGVIMGIAFIVGSIPALVGALNVGKRLSRTTAVTLERIGNSVLAGGWFAFGLGITASGNAYSNVSSWIMTGVGIGFLLRAFALYRIEKNIRTIVMLEGKGST